MIQTTAPAHYAGQGALRKEDLRKEHGTPAAASRPFIFLANWFLSLSAKPLRTAEATADGQKRYSCSGTDPILLEPYCHLTPILLPSCSIPIGTHTSHGQEWPRWSPAFRWQFRE